MDDSEPVTHQSLFGGTYYFVTLPSAVFGLIPPRLDLTCSPADPATPAAGCGTPVKVRLHTPLDNLKVLPRSEGSYVTAVVVRYGISFKTAPALLDLAVIVKVFFEILYTDEVIVTVSVITSGFTVMVALAVLDPTALVAVSERVITVFVVTAGAV
jgi:hypothetical protein